MPANGAEAKKPFIVKPIRLRIIKNIINLVHQTSINMSWKQFVSPIISLQQPHFLIIGAQKAATTSLHRYLVQHPQITAPYLKEVHYFWIDKLYNLGEARYNKRFFALKRPFSRPQPSYYAFDATPDNLYYPYVAERIYKYNPKLKLVVVLREPVSRAYSAWNMYKQLGKKKLPFTNVTDWLTPNYINNKPNNLRKLLYQQEGGYPSFENIVAVEMEYIKQKTTHLEPSFIRRGLYAQQLANFYQYFPKEQILVLEHKAIKANLAEQLNALLHFIGLPKYNWAGLNTKARNVHPYDEPIGAGIKQQLQEFYQPYNEQLFNLLGKNYNW